MAGIESVSGSGGDTIMARVGQLSQLDPAARPAAIASIDRAVADARATNAAIDLDIPGLIDEYQAAIDDPDRSDIAALIVRILLGADRSAIRAAIPEDMFGNALWRELSDVLDEASGAMPGEEETVRKIEFPPAAAETRTWRPAGTPPPAGAAPTAAMSTPQANGRTYRAYGLLDCAEIVLAGQRFPLEVGLSERQAAGVAGPPLELPAPEAASYELEVQLFADGFDLDHGQSWKHSLRVTDADRYPTVVVHLTARDLPDDLADRTISATFSIGGETLGVAMRSVRVTKDEAAIPTGLAPSRASGTNITAPTGQPKAHVTITIAKGLSDGALQWGITSDLPGIGLPADRPTISDVGKEPKEFATAIIRDLAVKGTQAGLLQLLQGIGQAVHDEMPRAVRQALTAAGKAVAPEKLQVLLLTEEPFVPWELAALDEAIDPGAPNFLGAQAIVGRWILDPDEPTDPPRTVAASSMAVVSGVYKSATLQRLEAAEEEAKLLQEAYRATPIEAQPDPVTSLLDGDPPADILHFAVHGKYDPQSPAEGLYLVSGAPIVPLQIRGGNLRRRAPFVFLNACQVGSAQTLLGNYGGMAQSFLKAGASAVVAPLWSIDDKIAQHIALEFYRQSFAVATPAGEAAGEADEPPPVAELLRRARVGLVTNAATPSSTYLAYQFYGHPTMCLSWGATTTPAGAADG